MNSIEQIRKRTEWFMHDRFGMFIHWGLYAIPARGEWVRSVEKISKEDYEVYFEEFNPVDFDPKKWAKMAKDAGMKYAVLTAKHHDGFCLFDSKLTDYKSTNTSFGRDIVKEYVEAFRSEGLKVGLYYSLIDWHHPDYPHYGDKVHPMRDNNAFANVEHNFDNYLDYMHGQVKELVTNYGKIDILWFDFSYDDMRGEKWRATELVKMIRSYLPDVIIDNRLEVSGEGFGSIATGNPTDFSGDFVSPEQIIPVNGITDNNGELIPWEACITMNNNWGYHASDKNFKSAPLIVRKLVECVSKGGNLLLNIGPDAKGNVPKESVDILAEVGQWMGKNGQSIYGAGIASFPKHDLGRFTQKGNKLYVHVFEGTIGPIPIAGIKKDQIKKVRLLSDGAELPVAESWTTGNYPDYVFISTNRDAVGTYALPDSTDTVIEIELK
jgi:alpha-L-fucosidase